jgi:hypothetical protein
VLRVKGAGLGLLPYAAIGLAFTTGCGDSIRMAPVSGAVTVGGQPLPKAGVTFTPIKGGRPAWATTDDQGRFELTTFQAGDGALVGEHIVTVAEPDTDAPIVPKNADAEVASLYAEMPTQPQRKKRKGALDPKFASRDTSGLTFTVKASGTNVADFNLTN